MVCSVPSPCSLFSSGSVLPWVLRPSKYLKEQNCEFSYGKYQIITKKSAPDSDSKWKAFSEKAAKKVIIEIDFLVGQIAPCIVSTQVKSKFKVEKTKGNGCKQKV